MPVYRCSFTICLLLMHESRQVANRWIVRDYIATCKSFILDTILCPRFYVLRFVLVTIMSCDITSNFSARTNNIKMSRSSRRQSKSNYLGFCYIGNVLTNVPVVLHCLFAPIGLAFMSCLIEGSRIDALVLYEVTIRRLRQANNWFSQTRFCLSHIKSDSRCSSWKTTHFWLRHGSGRQSYADSWWMSYVTLSAAKVT